MSETKRSPLLLFFVQMKGQLKSNEEDKHKKSAISFFVIVHNVYFDTKVRIRYIVYNVNGHFFNIPLKKAQKKQVL